METLSEWDVGQTWEWVDDGEKHHCVLIGFIRVDHEGDHIWKVLDLDTVEAGRVTTAVLFRGKRGTGGCSYWVRIT